MHKNEDKFVGVENVQQAWVGSGGSLSGVLR